MEDKQSPLIQEMQLLSIERKEKAIEKHSKYSRFSKLSVRDISSAMHYIRENWKSGMSQSILNMPFVMSIGNNSGTSGTIGLTTAFIAAFVNGFLSGSNHSIYMPSWVITGYNYQLAQTYGVEVLPWITVISGILIYLSNQLKWHHLSDYIPEYVIEGFYLGIGAFFLFGYSDYAFGITDAHSNRGMRVYPNLISMYYHYIQRGSLWYLLASLSVFGFLQMGRKLSKPFPWVILTTCIGLALGVLYPTERCLKYVYGEVSVDFQFLQFGNKFFPDLEIMIDIILKSVPIALQITIQNLLCARGAQTLTGVKCDYDQEVLCVSVANMVSGILGGLPCCASSRMYTLNIKMRDTNKWSSIINAMSIYIFYGYFSKYFLDMPLYIVSGQIFFLIYQFPPWNYLFMLYRTRRRLVLLKCLMVAWLSLNYGPIESTIIGSMHALFLFAQKMSAAASEIIVNIDNELSHKEFQQSMTQQIEGQDRARRDNRINAEDDLPDLSIKGSYTLYRFNGSLNYINIKNHVNQIKQLADTDYIIFSFRYVSVFDDQAIDKLAQLIESMMRSGHEIMITGLHRGMIQEMQHNEFFEEFFDICKDKYKTLGD